MSGSQALALVCTELFVGAQAKIWAPSPGTGTTLRGSNSFTVPRYGHGSEQDFDSSHSISSY